MRTVTLITVNKTDKRIQQAYQNVIFRRPSATTVVLKTNSMRQAIETAMEEISGMAEYETISVHDEKQNKMMYVGLTFVAMNEFILLTKYRGGKRIESGRVRFPALGLIQSTTERNQLWERMEHIRWGNYESV